MQMNIKMAEEAIAVARARDGNEGVTTMDHLPDWMAARAGGGSSAYGFTNYGGFCYNMSWPSDGGGSYGD